MARRTKPQSTSRKSVDELSAWVESEFGELKAILARFSAETDAIKMPSDVNAAFARRTVVMDRIEQEIRETQMSSIVLNAMERELSRRLGPPSLLLKRLPLRDRYDHQDRAS